MRYFVLLFVLLAPLAWADDKLTLVGPDGGDVELQPAEGQVLVLHFWATWCPTCIEDIRHLQDAASAVGAVRAFVSGDTKGKFDVLRS